MTRKRIAVCISGQLRTWKKTIKTWRPFIKNEHHVDVFVHTWDFNSVSTKINHDGTKTEKISTDELEEFSSLISPCKMMVESEKSFLPMSSTQAMQHPAHLSQFYGIMMASRLKRQHEISERFMYDIVIRVRPDLFFESNVAIIMKKIKEGCFNGFDLSWEGFNGKISDMFWITSSIFHDIAADTYINLGVIERNDFTNDTCCPENVLFFNLKRNSIPISNHNWYISIMRNSMDEASNLNGPRKDVW